MVEAVTTALVTPGPIATQYQLQIEVYDQALTGLYTLPAFESILL